MRLEIIDLGLVDFKASWQKQKELFQKIKAGLLDGAIIACRHHPVITLGRSSSRKNILVSPEELIRKGIVTYEVERGGDVTYHGPGQLVVYPILNLNLLKKDIRWYLMFLEELIIQSLASFGVRGQRIKGLTGVWVSGRKIASIGIAVSHWITFHGLSINIKSDDLSNFSLIRPCGADIIVTSLETEIGNVVCVDNFKEKLISQFLLNADSN